MRLSVSFVLLFSLTASDLVAAAPVVTVADGKILSRSPQHRVTNSEVQRAKSDAKTGLTWGTITGAATGLAITLLGGGRLRRFTPYATFLLGGSGALSGSSAALAINGPVIRGSTADTLEDTVGLAATFAHGFGFERTADRMVEFADNVGDAIGGPDEDSGAEDIKADERPEEEAVESEANP